MTAYLVLHPDPQLVHLGEVEEDEVDAVVDLAWVLALLEVSGLQGVWENVPGALKEVIPQKQSPQGMLDSSAHFHQVPKDVLPAVLVGLDVDGAHSDEEVESRNNVASILNQLV